MTAQGKVKSRRKSDDFRKSVEEIVAEINKFDAPRNGLDVSSVAVMKPETRDRPFSQPGWLFELKYDGFRMLAERRGGEARLRYRSGREATQLFPEIARAVAALPFELILDGEAVTLDAEGRPRFEILQRRAHRIGRIDAEQAAVATPATYFAFDLVAFEGYDLRPVPLAARKDLLRRALEAAGVTRTIRILDVVPDRGEDFYAAVAGLGLEGIVAKRADSPYRAGLSADWLKVRVDRTADFAIIGFEPAGPTGLRNLHLGVCEGSRWIWAGTVGSGLDGAEMREIRSRLEPARRSSPAAAGTPSVPAAIWVEPELVCEVRYKEITLGGHLRQPVFLRLREDKHAEECLTPLARGESGRSLGGGAPLPVACGGDGRGVGGEVPFTNLDKVFWPDEGITKGDLVEYYRTIAPWMLPYLSDRPLVLDRYPDGIKGKSFFQRNAPDMAAGRVRTVPILGEGGTRAIDFFLADDAGALLWLVNLGVIPFHVWSSRLPDLDRPDWSILDLDPKGAPFAWVVRIAQEIRGLCEQIGMPCFIKTSGGSGLHVLLPLGARCGHDPARQLAELLARIVTDRLPEIATTARAIPARRGRVYVDALQNGRGKLLAAPFSVRPRPGAPVSTPLDWKEVDARLDPSRFTIRTVPARMKRRGADPLRPVLDLSPDLMSVLERLALLL